MVASCLALTAAGIAIPYVQSLPLVVLRTILPDSFGNTAAATNAVLTSGLPRSPADARRALAFLVLGGNLFGLLAPIVTGYIVQAAGSFASAFLEAGVPGLVGAAASRALTRHTPGRAAPARRRDGAVSTVTSRGGSARGPVEVATRPARTDAASQDVLVAEPVATRLPRSVAGNPGPG